MPTSKRLIGRRIAYVRKSAGITQAELAEKINISEKYLSRIECGKQLPNVMIIVKICEVLHVSSDELLLFPTVTSSLKEKRIEDELISFSEYDKEQIIQILKCIKLIKNKY